VLKVEKIQGLNLPGTPGATSACRGIPLLTYFVVLLEFPFLQQSFIVASNSFIDVVYNINAISWIMPAAIYFS